MDYTEPQAVIDMGTNTFLLLVARWTEGEMEILYREQQFVRLGKGGISDSRIAPEAIERGKATLAGYQKKVEGYGSVSCRAIATSALRNADNRGEVLDAFEEVQGHRPLVIDGDCEAQLIYEGVQISTPPTDDIVLVMDIGGGSVEFILGRGKEVLWKQSFEIGAQRLCDKFFHEDPIPKDSVQQLMEYADDALKPLKKAFAKFPPKRYIGSAGTFDTLWDLHVGRQGDLPESRILSYEDYLKVYGPLMLLPKKERLALPGMMEKRVEMIVVASCLVTYIFMLTGQPAAHIANGALKEGALSRLLQQKPLLDG